MDLSIEIERIVLQTDEDAQRHKFIGSPTVRIFGLDVIPDARLATQYGLT